MLSTFRPFLILIILLFPFTQANSKAMTLDDFYSEFISSEVFSDAKKDVEFFVSHFHETGAVELFVNDYIVLMNCHVNYEEGNPEGVETDKCYEGEVFFKVEFHINTLENSSGEKKRFDVGYVSGAIDFKDPHVLKEILHIQASFYGPEGNKPLLVNK